VSGGTHGKKFGHTLDNTEEESLGDMQVIPTVIQKLVLARLAPRIFDQA
jgi:hypothetical protein